MRTVLIADSDAFQRQLIDMLLAVDNHRVLGFETGRSVLEYLQAQVPDMVILDYNLSDINGADLCAKMKKVKRLVNVPVILVTAAHKLELVRGIASAVRADLVLAKPLGDKHLREQVLELLQRSDKPEMPEPKQPEFTKPSTTAIQIDPILEQALANLGHEVLGRSFHEVKKPNLDKTSSINTITPVPIDRGDTLPYTLESSFQPALYQPQISDTTPPLFQDLTQPEEPSYEVHSDAFQKDANAALESLLGQGVSQKQDVTQNQAANKNLEDTGVFELLDDEMKRDDGLGDGGISEQELLDSLQTPLETSRTPVPDLNPPPFSSESESANAPKDTEPFSHEPQIYTLGSTDTSLTPELATSFEQTVSDIESELTSWRTQVQQLAAENERLRATLLELETGESLATSKGYLDMVEELEMLRRLSDIQVKQMDNLQRQNQKLMEDAQQSQERRRGLFGFLQPKNPS
jgi:DNA-binding response OmpR family regulator